MRKRKLNRLKVWNYNRIGYYYITINTKNFVYYFGKIRNNKLELSEIGRIANKCWIELPVHINNISLDEFIIMPNHFHGIIKILPSDENKPESEGINVSGTGMTVPYYDKKNISNDKTNNSNDKRLCSNVSGTGMPVPYGKINVPNDKTKSQYKKLPIIIGSYKSAVTKLAHKKGYGYFGWHKSYYDHIVRNEKDLIRIRKYIRNNPVNWNNK